MSSTIKYKASYYLVVGVIRHATGKLQKRENSIWRGKKNR